MLVVSTFTRDSQPADCKPISDLTDRKKEAANGHCGPDQASSSNSTAANFSPSSIDKLAPPPVLTWETLSANPIC